MIKKNSIRKIIIVGLSLSMPVLSFGQNSVTMVRGHSIPVELLIKSDKAVYETDEKITVNMHLRNLDTRTLVFDAYGWPIYEITLRITDSKGREYEPKAESELKFSTRAEKDLIKLGPEVELVYDVSDNLRYYYGTLPPETYYITLELNAKYTNISFGQPISKSPDFMELILVSNTITVKIIEKAKKLVQRPCQILSVCC